MEKSIPAPYDLSQFQFDPYSIFNSLPDSILLLNLEGQVISVNQKFTDFLGYSAEEIIGLSHKDVVHLLLAKDPVDYPVVWQAFKQACQGNPFTAKRKFYHKEGYTIPVEIHETQVFNTKGEPAGILLEIKDRHAEFWATVTNLLNSSLDISQILYNVTRIAVEHLALSSNAIFLFEPAENRLKLVSCNAFRDEDLEKVLIPLGEGAPGIIAQTRKPLYVANLHEDPLIPEIGRSIHDAKSSIGFPLICRDELLGVIAFDAETIRKFSEREIRLFETIAGQVSLVLYNSRLLARFEHLSITDGLTGAYNHRYFQEKLTESLRTAQQKSIPMSLLLIDLDHFKNYNDTFGHPKGDELLKEFTQLLMNAVRQSDLVCRYGGEEFAIILQGCPVNCALQIAERIRSACENQSFYGKECLPDEKVTISIGVASFPDAKNCEDLIIKADKALYKAKKSRNRVECLTTP